MSQKRQKSGGRGADGASTELRTQMIRYLGLGVSANAILGRAVLAAPHEDVLLTVEHVGVVVVEQRFVERHLEALDHVHLRTAEALREPAPE